MAHFIKKFSEININDISEVGGKNASLGEMFNALSDKGVIVPDGFATTVPQTFQPVEHSRVFRPSYKSEVKGLRGGPDHFPGGPG